MVVVGRVGQPSAVLLSRIPICTLKFALEVSNLTANFARPKFPTTKEEGPPVGGGEGGWSKNMAREVPFIVLRPYLGHSNAFAWKINENVWQFHLMWKPHEPQFNCSILCGCWNAFFHSTKRVAKTTFRSSCLVRANSPIYELLFLCFALRAATMTS